MARGTTASSLDATRLEESEEEAPPGDAEGEEDSSLLLTSFQQAEGAAEDGRAGLSQAENTRNVRKKNASSSSSSSSSATSSSPEDAKNAASASSAAFSSSLGASKVRSLPLVRRSEVGGESSCFISVFLSSLDLLCPSSTSLVSPFAYASLVAPYRASPVSACFLLSQVASLPPPALCLSSRPAARPDPRGKSPSLLIAAVPAYLLALRQLQRLLALPLLDFSSSSGSSVQASPSAYASPAVCSLNWRRAFRRLVLPDREREASLGEIGCSDLLSLPLRPWQTEWRRARYAACVSAYAVFRELAAEREREAQRISERGREEGRERERRTSGAEETDRGDAFLGALYDAALHALRATDRQAAEEGEAEQTDSEEWGEDLTSIPIEDGVDFDGEETGLPRDPTRRDTELTSLLTLLEEFRETAQRLSIAFCKAKRKKKTHPTDLASASSASAGLHEGAEELRSGTARGGAREAKPRSVLPPPVPFGSFGRKQRISEGSGWVKPSPQSLAVVDWQLHLPRGALARALLACPRCSKKQSTNAGSELKGLKGACNGNTRAPGCGDPPPTCCLFGPAGAALWRSSAPQGGDPEGRESESRENGEEEEEEEKEQGEKEQGKDEEERGEGAEGKSGDGGVSVRLVLHLDTNSLDWTASEARVEEEEEETMPLLHELVGDLLQRAVWTMKKSEVSVFFVPFPGLLGLESAGQQGNSAAASLSSFALSSKLCQVHAPACVPLVFSLRLLDFQPLFPSLSSLSPSFSSSRKEEGGRGDSGEVQQIAGLVLEASRRSRSLLQIAEEFQSFCSIIFHLLLERDPRAPRLLLSLILSSRGESSETRALSGLPAEDERESRGPRSVVRRIFPTRAEERLVLSLFGSELEKTNPEKNTRTHAAPSPPDFVQTPPPSPASQKRSRWWHPGALRSASRSRRLLSLLSSSSVPNASPASPVFCREDSRELEKGACARLASKQSVDEGSSEVEAHAGAEETLQDASSHLRGRAQTKKSAAPSPLLLGHLETETSACDDNSLPATPSLCAASACESEARRQRENKAKAEGERESKRRFAGLRTTIKSPLWRRRAGPLPSSPGSQGPQTSGEKRGEEEQVGGEEAARGGTPRRTTKEDVFRVEGDVEEGQFFSVHRRGVPEFEAGSSAGLWGGARSALPSLADLASLQKQLYAHQELEVQGISGRRETDKEDAEKLARSIDSVFEKGVVIQGVYFQVIESEEVWRHLHRERQVARAALFRFQQFPCPPLFLLLEMSARRLFASPVSEVALLPCLRRSGVSSSSTYVECEAALMPHPLSRMGAPNPRPRRSCSEFPAKEEQEREGEGGEGDGEEEDVSLRLHVSGGWSFSKDRLGVPSLPSLFPLVSSCIPSFSVADTLKSSSPRRSLSRRPFSRDASAPLKAEAPPFLVVDPEADSERQVAHARKVAVEASKEERQGLLLAFASEELRPAVVQWTVAGAVDSEDREGGGGGRREKKEKEMSLFFSKEEETAALQAASQALGLSGNCLVLSPLTESSSLETCRQAAPWLPSFALAAAATDAFASSGRTRYRGQVLMHAEESAGVARRAARSSAGNLWNVAGQLCRVWVLSAKRAAASEKREETAEREGKQGKDVSPADSSPENSRSPLFGLLLLPLRLASSWNVRPSAFDFDALPLAAAEETRRGGRREDRFPWVAPSSTRCEAASSEVREFEGERNSAKREGTQPLGGAGGASEASLGARPSFCLVGNASCLRGDTSRSVRKVGSFLLSEVSGHLGHPQGLRAILHAKFLPVGLAEWLLLADLFLAFPENRSQSVPEQGREKRLREQRRKGRQSSGPGRAGDAAETRRSPGEDGAEEDEETEDKEQEGGEEEVEEEGREEGEGEEDEREKEENEKEEFRCFVRRREGRAREMFALIAADLLGSAVKRALRHLSPSFSAFSALVGAATGWLFSGHRDAAASSSAVQAGVSLSLAFQFLRVTTLFPSLRGRFSPLLPLAASQSSPVFLRRSLAYHLGLSIPAFTDPPTSSSLSSLSSSLASSGYGAARKRRIWSHLEGRGGENVQWRCARLSQILRGGDWSETQKASENKRGLETPQETVWGVAGETPLGAEVPAPKEQRVWVRMRLKSVLEAEDVACLSLSLGQLPLDTLSSSSEAQDWPGREGIGGGSRDDAAKERQKRPSHNFQVPSLLSLLQHDVALAASCTELAVPSSSTFAAFLARHPPSSRVCLRASRVSRETRKRQKSLVEARDHSSERREDVREASEDSESIQIPILRRAAADALPRRLRAAAVSQVLLRSLLGEERRQGGAAEVNEQTEWKGEKKSGSSTRVVKLGATPGGLADLTDRHLLHFLLHAVVEFDCWRGFMFEKEGGNSLEDSCPSSSSSSSSEKSDAPLRGTEKRRQELVFVSLVASVENLQVSVHHSLELQIVLLLVQGLNRLQRGFLASSRLRLMKAADLFESLWGPVSWEGLLSDSASLPLSSDAKMPARKETQTRFSSAHPLMLFPVWLLLLLSYCGAVSSTVSSSVASMESPSQEEKSKSGGGISSPSFLLSLPRGVPQGDFLTACVAVYADLLRLLRLRCPAFPLPAGPPHLLPSSLLFSPHLTIDRRCLVSPPFPSAPERLRPVTNIFSDENAAERNPLESLSGLSAAPHASQMPQDVPSEAFRFFGCTYTPKFPRKEHCRMPVEAVLSAQQIAAILCFNLRRCQPHLSRWLASVSLFSPRGDFAVSSATEVGCSFLAALLASPAPPPSPSLFESSRAVSPRKTQSVCMRRSTPRCLLPAVFLTASAPDSEAASLFSGGSEDARTRRDSAVSQLRDLRFLDDNEGHLERWWRTQKRPRVFACGSNERGALGVGRPAFFPFDPVLGEKENEEQVRRGTDVWWTPQPQRICALPPDVTSVAGGAAHCVALTSSGCLYTWGANEAGQCGVSSPSQKTRRSRRHSSDVRGQCLAASAAFSWISFSDISLPLKTPEEEAEGVEGIEEGELDAFLSLPVRLDVFEESETECLPSEKFRDVVSASTLSLSKPFSPKVTFSLVACGADFSAAASAAGCLYTWGSNTCGVLGLGDTRPRAVPSLVSPEMFRSVAALHASPEGAHAPPSAPRVTALACGNSHMGVLLEGGALYMWGSNWYTECGYCSLLEEKAVRAEGVGGEDEGEEDDKEGREEGSGEDLLYPREICVFELAPLRRDHHHVYEAVMHWMFINSNEENQTGWSAAASSVCSASPAGGSGLEEASSWVQAGARVARTRLGVKMNVCQTKKSFSVVLTPAVLPDLLRSVVAYTKDAASAQKLLNYRLRFSLLSCGSVHTLALGDTKASAEVAGGGERDRRSLQQGRQVEETLCEAGAERDEHEGHGESQRHSDAGETLEKKRQKTREETVHTGFLYSWGRDSGNCLGLGRPPGASSNAYPSRIPTLFFRVERREERGVERQGEENGERQEAQGHCEPLAFRRIAAGGTASGAIDDKHRLWLWGDVSGICPDFFPPPHRPECLSPSLFEVDSRLLSRSRQESVFDVSLCSSEKAPLEVALLHFPVEGTRLLLAPLAGGLVALGDGCGVQGLHQAVSAARSVSALRQHLAVDEWEEHCRRLKAGKRPEREERQEEERTGKGKGREKREQGEREEKARDEERLEALRVPGAATVTPRFWVDKSRMERLRGIHHLVLPAGGRVDQVAGGTDFIVILSSPSQPGYSLSSSLCLPLLLSPPRALQSSGEVASRSGSTSPSVAAPLAYGSNVGLQSPRALPVRVERTTAADAASGAPSTSSFGPVASTALSAFISKLRVSPVASPLARDDSDVKPASPGLSLPGLFGGFSLSTLVVPRPAVPASAPEAREKRETKAAEERETETARDTHTGTEAERTTLSRRCSVESKALIFSGEKRGSEREVPPGGPEGAGGVEPKETGGTHASVSPRNDRMVALLEGLDKGSGRLFTLVNKVLQLPFSIPEERLDFHESQQASDLQVSRSVSSPRCASSSSPFASSSSPFASSMQCRPSGVTGAALFASETGAHAAAGQRASLLPKTLRPASWTTLESTAFSSVSSTASASRAESAAEGAASGSWAGVNSRPEPRTPSMNSRHSSLSHISWELAPEGASRKSSIESDNRGAQVFDSRDEGFSFSDVSAGRSSSSVSAGFASRFSEGRRDQAVSFVSTAFPPAKQTERREEEWRKEEEGGQGRRRQLWVAQEPLRSAWVRPASFSSSLVPQKNAGRVSGTSSFSTNVSAQLAGHRGFAFEPAESTSPAAGTPAPAASFVFSSSRPPSASSLVGCGEAKRNQSEVSSQETLWRNAGVEPGLAFRESCLVQVHPAEVYRHLEPSRQGDSQRAPASTAKTSSEFLEPWRRVVHTAGSFASVHSQERRGISDPFVAASGVRTLSGVDAARALPRVAMPEGGFAGDASLHAGTLRGESPALQLQAGGFSGWYAGGFPELHAGPRVWPSFSGGAESALRGVSEPTPHLAYFTVSDACGTNAAWAGRTGEGQFAHAEIPNFRASQCAWRPVTQTQTVGSHPPGFPMSGQP
uniref:Putative glutamic acid-rcih protein n=1 Tax=Toxoplasma gondii COUG TaxID=1074873 RepID=A0A2G8XVD0_TOXGO|nr:putative glutamic acid-rcih protein [Toxoplasma gondii COUG]